MSLHLPEVSQEIVTIRDYGMKAGTCRLPARRLLLFRTSSHEVNRLMPATQVNIAEFLHNMNTGLFSIWTYYS